VRAKKNILLSIFLLILFIIILSVFLFKIKATYIIALVGPMSGKNSINGEAMTNGISLYLKQLKNNPVFNDFDIQLQTYDDENSVEKAIKIASDIASKDNVVMVIGHYYSTTSIAAGNIYKKAGIPAITASATAEKVIDGNEFYFRIVPGNAFQGKFIANYIHSVLKRKHVIIINDRDSYGSDLADNFEQAAHELKIKYQKYSIDASTLDKELDFMITRLRDLKEPGVVFLATHMPEAATIIKSLKYPGAKFTIIGPDSISSKAFIEYLKKISFQELSQPGYHSNDIFAISPFIFDIAGERAQIFKKEYKNYFNHEPSWVDASYYDAMHVVAHALKYANGFKHSNIQATRINAFDYLNQLNIYENGLEGVTGRIFFTNREVLRPLAVGVFKNQKLISALSQYQLLSVETNPITVLKQILEGQTINVNDTLMSKMRLVYTGIDINEISELNITEGTYLIDFYLWFRYQEEFEGVEQIEFVNSINQLSIDKNFANSKNKNITRVLDHKKNGIITRAYNVRATFNNKFDLRNYPFDSQTLSIKLRHSEYTLDKLIFIVDIIGMRQFIKNEYHKEIVSYSLSGWELQDPIFFQDYIRNSSSLGNPDTFNSKNTIMFSQFNTNIKIKRKVFSYLSKNLCLVLVLLVVSYLIYLIPPDQFGIRVSIGMSTLLTIAFSHNRLTQGLPVSYLMAMEHIYFGAYFLSMQTIFFSVLIYLVYKKANYNNIDTILKHKNYKRIAKISLIGLILHPMISLLITYIIVSQYLPEKILLNRILLLSIPLIPLVRFLVFRPLIKSRIQLIKQEVLNIIMS
jgi:branched-chain amino acid transport system substrate-binding protein